MQNRSIVTALLVLTAHGSHAQTLTRKAASAPDARSVHDEDDDESAHHVLFGIAAGELTYDAGRREQALGAVVRWIPTPWLSLSTTPTTVRASESATSTLPASTRSGLTDVPVEASVAHGFGGFMKPSVALSLAATLPVGDTASGLGSGEVGYATSGSVGFTPTEGVWVHLGAGRSLTRFSVGSAFSSGTGWGDASAGYSLRDGVEVSAGYGTDLGAVDSTLGRSRSLDAGTSVAVGRAGTVNFSASHGIAGAAPRWSFALGVGTAFPYLNHLGGSSTSETLQQAFGGGTHGLPKSGSGGNSGLQGRGRSKKGSP
ncbi:MAG: transporter [Gemmatimonadota bacterium]|nr:transporter [Gemmatimonadota bacterium]